MHMSDPLDDALGLEPLPYVPPVIDIPDAGTEGAFARENIARMIGKMEHVIDQMMDVTRISQHPRSAEVTGLLMKNYIDANHELLKMKKTDRETSGEVGGPQTVNNTLVMTTDEVLRLLKKDRS